MVVYTFHPSAQEAEEGASELKARLVYKKKACLKREKGKEPIPVLFFQNKYRVLQSIYNSKVDALSPCSLLNNQKFTYFIHSSEHIPTFMIKIIGLHLILHIHTKHMIFKVSVIAYWKKVLGLERCLSTWNNLLLFQRTQVSSTHTKAPVPLSGSTGDSEHTWQTHMVHIHSRQNIYSHKN